MIEYLVEQGVLEVIYYDEDDNPVYRMTAKAQEVVPELWNEHIREFNFHSFTLWMKDMIDIRFDEEGDPLVGLNENSSDIEKIKTLTSQERTVLYEIIDAWKFLGDDDDE